MSKDYPFDELLKKTLVEPGKKLSLAKDFDPGYTPDDIDKKDAEKMLEDGIEKIAEFQQKLYAQDTYSLLIILQALDAAGKDSTIRHVMSGINPQGCQVFSFKAPSAEELDHDYLWRVHSRMPRRGNIGIFNRSYYEEVLVVRVHPEILEAQRLPRTVNQEGIWKERFDQINTFEKYMTENGTHILKFFLNVSKEEQKQRFLDRIDEPEKHWKFSWRDVEERQHWDEYQNAYQEMLEATSTKWAPWYVIPADNKWFMRLAVGSLVYHTMRELNPRYPSLPEDELEKLYEAKAKLEAEDDTKKGDKKKDKKKKDKD